MEELLDICHILLSYFALTEWFWLDYLCDVIKYINALKFHSRADHMISMGWVGVDETNFILMICFNVLIEKLFFYSCMSLSQGEKRTQSWWS